MLLADRELFISNWFIAALACLLGFSAALNMVFNRPISRKRTGGRIRRSHILADVNVNVWYMLNWLFGLFKNLGVFYFIFPMMFELSLSEEYLYLLILLPFVIYFSMWPAIFKTYGKRGYKWAGLGLLCFAGLSLGMASINILGKQNVEDIITRNEIAVEYRVNVPQSRHCERLNVRKSMSMQLYIGYRVNEPNGKPRIVVDNFDEQWRELDVKEIAQHFRLDHQMGGLINVVLHVDSTVEMGFVKEVLEELCSYDQRRILFTTTEMGTKYPFGYTPVQYRGMLQVLPPYFGYINAYLDSLEAANPPANSVVFPAYIDFWVPKGPHHMHMTTNKNNEFVVAEKVVSEAALRDTIIRLMTNHHDYVLVAKTDGEASYGSYIKLKDIFYTVLDSLRNDYAMQQFGQEYTPGGYLDSLDAVRKKYPARYFEPHREHLRLEQMKQQYGVIDD